MIDEYIKRHGKRLYGLCLTLCADKFEADDLYQDTWLKALQNIEKYDAKMPFEPWLTKICVNLYRDKLRRLARNLTFDGFSSQAEKTAVIENVPAPAAADYAPLREAIAKLPEKLRLTVVLFYFRDMNTEQTAKLLDVPPGTVKSRLNKARKMLKEALDDERDV